MISLLHEPEKVAGVEELLTAFQEYFQTGESDTYELMCETKERNNPDISKRLGFLTELYFPTEDALIEACKIDLTAGICDLHPNSKDSAVFEKWQVKVSADLLEAAKKLKVKNAVGLAVYAHKNQLI